MAEKAKVTQEQFDWLEKYKSNEEINYAIDNQVYKKRPDSPIAGWKPSEVARALYSGYEIEQNIKAGDWVVRKDGSHFAFDEMAMRVLHVDEEMVYFGGLRNILTSAVRLATEEEVEQEIEKESERLLWDSLNRNTGQFYDGDLGVTHSGTQFTEIRHLQQMYEEGRLKGFYPKESFIRLGKRKPDF